MVSSCMYLDSIVMEHSSLFGDSLPAMTSLTSRMRERQTQVSEFQAPTPTVLQSLPPGLLFGVMGSVGQLRILISRVPGGACRTIIILEK